jgi:hypothetical protein
MNGMDEETTTKITKNNHINQLSLELSNSRGRKIEPVLNLVRSSQVDTYMYV